MARRIRPFPFKLGKRSHDCGGNGCEECQVCRRLSFLEWVGMVAPRDVPCSVEKDPIDDYIRATYPGLI